MDFPVNSKVFIDKADIGTVLRKNGELGLYTISIDGIDFIADIAETSCSNPSVCHGINRSHHSIL